MIARDLTRATENVFDLAIVGGGIYGATLLQAAARNGLSAFLCESQDFGGSTSSQSLRIVHGGLRYLQTLDLRRFRQSVAARRGLARRFPTLVQPLQCLMPLYGDGLKRPAVMRLALQANDLLSRDRNRALAPTLHLPRGEILDAAATQSAFPQVRRAGLQGAARWSDYSMRSSERILIELLRDACRHGAVALNYARGAQVLIQGHRRVQGLRVEDRLSKRPLIVRARAVVNCCGPQAQALINGREAASPDLFIPSLAFNLLLDARLPASPALAIAAPRPGAPVLFLVPQKDSVLAGTMHLPRPTGTIDAKPTEAELEDFLTQLREAMPGFEVRRPQVRRVFAGLLPAQAVDSATLVKRELLRDHSKVGGLRGLYSVVGVKYTTAVDVAVQTLRMMGLPCENFEQPLPLAAAGELLADAGLLWTQSSATVRRMLLDTLQEEAVQTLDDLILRRANWAVTELAMKDVRTRVRELIGNEIQLKAERQCV